MLNINELYKKSYDELIDYFDEIDIDRKQLLALLDEMGFRRHQGKLKEFVARQISETALFLYVTRREYEN